LAAVSVPAVISPVVVTGFLGWEPLYPVDGFSDPVLAFWLSVAAGGAVAVLLGLRPDLAGEPQRHEEGRKGGSLQLMAARISEFESRVPASSATGRPCLTAMTRWHTRASSSWSVECRAAPWDGRDHPSGRAAAFVMAQTSQSSSKALPLSEWPT
jgi:hypothetical protein